MRITPRTTEEWTRGKDFAAWLSSVSQRSGNKEVVLLIEGASSLHDMPEELRAEFLGALLLQKAKRAAGGTVLSGAPLKVWAVLCSDSTHRRIGGATL